MKREVHLINHRLAVVCFWNDDVLGDSRLRNDVAVKPQLTELHRRNRFTVEALTTRNADYLHGRRRRSIDIGYQRLR